MKNSRNIFDISQYSEKGRKIIFGVVLGVGVAIVATIMFFFTPKDEPTMQTSIPETPSATQAPVDNETVKDEQPVEEKVFLDNEQEADEYQKQIIQESLERERQQTDEVVQDIHAHDAIENSDRLMEIAREGILQHCTVTPNETDEQKKERIKPYFHEDSPRYTSPGSIYYLQNCSIEAVTTPSHDENHNIFLHVGVAWAAQLEADGSASTGYTQYRVTLDEGGIINFYD